MKTRIAAISTFLLFLLLGTLPAAAQTSTKAPSTPAFFATLFSDKSAKEIREELIKFGAHKAAKVEIGDLLQGAPYFHFVIPRDKLEATLTYLKSSGTLTLDGSQDPLASESQEIRFVMWLSPTSRLKKMGSNTIFIQRIVKNPDQVREEMRAYLKTKKYSFSGQQFLTVRVKNLIEYERLLFYVQAQGNMLIKQTPQWDGKTLRFSFTQQKAGKGVKRSQLFFTPARDTSKENWQQFQEKIWAQPSGVKELPAFYLQVIKYGDLSIYPGKKGEDPEKKISQSALRKIEAKVVGTPPPKDVYESMINTGEGLYLETSDELIPTYLTRPIVRGYYQGVLPLTWNDEKVVTRNGYFQIQAINPEVKPENVLKVGEDEKSRQLKFMVDEYAASSAKISGSFIKNAAGKMAVLTNLQGHHWFERPFGVSRASPLFQNLGLRAKYLQFTNFVAQEDLQIVGGELAFRFLHKIQNPADGLVIGLLYENISSGEFNANAGGINLSYETVIPFPLFKTMPKTMEAYVRTHLMGPGLNIDKSMIYGLRGKMQVSEKFYLHGGLQKMEANIDSTSINRQFNANVMMFDGGFGVSF